MALVENKLTTSEWVHEKASTLAMDIAIHIKVMAEELSQDDQADLLRLIMISVRNWSEDQKGGEG